MNRSRFPRILAVASIAVALPVFLAACGSKSSTSAQFSPSMTAPSPGLVKLVQRSHSGSRVVVDVLIYGPEPNLDLLGFQFGIKIENPGVAKLVTQASYGQTALVAADGQAITMNVDGASDPSLVSIEVIKTGGGAGNGIPGNSAVVIELPFDVQGSAGTTLTLVGRGLDEPRALDSHRVPIAAVTFDPASAGVRSVTTGGGGY
jgi:hypothetical protein